MRMTAAQYKKLNQPLEKVIQQEIINYLRAKGYYVQRMNSGKYSVGEGVSKRFIKGAEAGTPDIMAFRGFIHTNVYCDRKSVDLLFVEVKREGNKPTDLQQMKMRELEEYGARCIVAHSVEEVEDQL